jgi:hypothetical protein
MGFGKRQAMSLVGVWSGLWIGSCITLKWPETQSVPHKYGLLSGWPLKRGGLLEKFRCTSCERKRRPANARIHLMCTMSTNDSYAVYPFRWQSDATKKLHAHCEKEILKIRIKIICRSVLRSFRSVIPIHFFFCIYWHSLSIMEWSNDTAEMSISEY